MSSFKFLVVWKWGLPRPKVSYVCLSPSPTLSYTTSYLKKEFFATQGSPEGLLRVLFRFHSNEILFRFHSDKVLFRFYSDKALFRFHSDKVLFRFLSVRVLWRIPNDKVLLTLFSMAGGKKAPYQMWSHDHIYNIIWAAWLNFVGNVIDGNYDVINFISKYLFLRRPRVAIFGDIIKTVTIFINTIFQGSKKVTRIRNYVLNCNLYQYFFT